MLFAKEILENEGSGRKMQPGIHTGCKVTSVVVGDRWIDFNYESPNGEIHNQRAWFPEMDKLTPAKGQTMLEALKEADEREFTHMVNHMRIFLTPDELNVFSAPDLRTAAVKCAALLTPKLGYQKVDIKVLYDDKGVWSKVAPRKYIAKHVEGEPTSLVITDWELKNRMTKKVDPAVENNDGPLIY